MTNKAYAQAGVDIALKETLLRSLKPELKKASRPEVIGGIGAFGGLFDISKLKYKQPVLVSSTDSVGTKLKVATLANDHSGVGADIVNHCLNDIAVMGAEPLFFLDYFASDKLSPEIFTAVLKSLAKACEAANCALIGGETAELPGVYQPGEYDLVGCIVGVVERKRILSGEAIKAGDAIIGIASSGLHTNGYSLARKIVFEKLKMSPKDKIPGTKTSIGAALLQPHTNYSTVLRSLLKKFNLGPNSSKRKGNSIYGAAHITGGGFTGNINRILPDIVDAVIEVGAWPEPELFRFLCKNGPVDFIEAYEVWNMGVAMTLVVNQDDVADIIKACGKLGHKAWLIGHTCVGSGKVELHDICPF
ncbi:MAG: phosphoribosylformylglycinamidine cyclo-ligase [Verrucomicrobiota bacterium]|nr:phosphoribosylformylglycinamidine cyclo-ligase [Verrucomicrobiota bacterium]